MSGPKPTLAVVIDGAAMPEDEARALWTEFSRHMDEHRGDTSGFAKARGWASVSPEYRAGQAVLVVWTREVPKPAAPPRPNGHRPRPGASRSRARPARKGGGKGGGTRR